MKRISVDIGGTFTDCFFVWDDIYVDARIPESEINDHEGEQGQADAGRRGESRPQVPVRRNCGERAAGCAADEEFTTELDELLVQLMGECNRARAFPSVLPKLSTFRSVALVKVCHCVSRHGSRGDGNCCGPKPRMSLHVCGELQ